MMKLIIRGSNLYIIFLFTVLLSSCNKPVQINQSKSEDSNNETIKKNTITEILAKPQVPVLCYHRITNGRNDEYTVTPEAFGSQMQILNDSGYHSVGPDQMYDYLVYNKSLPAKPFMITFDDSREEHFTIAAPELEKHGFRGVFFIMTITYNKKNYMTTQQIAELAKRGHTIGLHSWDHTMATKYMTDSVMTKQIVEPGKRLESILGRKVEYFAYPYGITNHESSRAMNKYFKLSFILSSKRDTIEPLQTLRRMIVPSGWTPGGMLKAMHKTFDSKRN